MSKIVISFMASAPIPKDPNSLFAILDIDTEQLEWIKLDHLPNTDNFVHGMGICYNGKYFCGGIIPIRERLASNILTINLETGEKKISYLKFTKAIHGIKTIDENRLLANSTQTDCISELIIENGDIINEDLFYHFISNEKWENTKLKITETDKPINYRGSERIDDNYHVNSIELQNLYLYCSMFIAQDSKYWGSNYKGHIYNLTTKESMIKNLDQPHTVYIDSKQNLCVCNSAKFSFIVKDKFEILLDGYTRGICEDVNAGGYWIGISAYRKYNERTSKWIEKYRGDQPLDGARIQFVTYDGKIERTIELSQYGREIFDLIPYVYGIWNQTLYICKGNMDSILCL